MISYREGERKGEREGGRRRARATHATELRKDGGGRGRWRTGAEGRRTSVTSLFTVTLSHNLRGDRSRVDCLSSRISRSKELVKWDRVTTPPFCPKNFEVCLSKFPLSRRLISEKRKEQ